MALDETRDRLQLMTKQVIAWRRHLHRHPELSFHEYETAKFVFDVLTRVPGALLSRPTPTSIVARIQGLRPGRVVGIRADMDALPINEETGLSYASEIPGVMHACGHDGHTAMLLGAAHLLAELRNQFTGEVRLIFQHAEETPPGGAQELVARGVLAGVDAIIGAHLWLAMDTGLIGVREGPLMAATDTFSVRVLGRGGHAGQPHLTVDSITIAAEIVTNLQHVISREVDPLQSAVISVTRISGGNSDNVIPSFVDLGGTVRVFDANLRVKIPTLIERIIRGVTEAHRATYQFVYQQGYASVVNDSAVTAILRGSLESAFGPIVVEDVLTTMGGEDFSSYQGRVPGSFFFVGARNEARGITFPHHHPQFTIDEEALDIGVLALVVGSLALLEPHLGVRP